MRKTWRFVATVCLSVALAACGSESTSTTENRDSGTATATPPTTPSYAAGAADINIEGSSFGQPVTVTPGALITVSNSDSAEHSVTSDTPGLFDVHIDADTQETFVAPTEPGEYQFHCIYHPSMKSTLIVK